MQIAEGEDTMRNSNGFGSVIKLSGKRRRPYAVRITAGWTDDGKQRFKYVSYHAKKAEAVQALLAFNQNPHDIDAARITFEEVYARWSERGYRTLSDSSVKGYKSAYKRCERLYGRVFKELRKTHLQGVLDAIEAPSMAELTKFLFQKLYNFALENDIVTKDYSQFLTLPDKPPAKKKVPFTKNEITTLWENVEEVRHADIALILIYTGMRIGELLDMKKENVHLEERYMIGGSKTKAGKNRVIPIHKRIVPLLAKRMEESDSEWVFINSRGTKMQYSPFMKYHWPNVMEDIGAKHSPHDTRHTFISEMDRLGVNPVTLKRIVGHSNENITQHYTHKMIEELKEAVDRLE